MPKVYVAEGVVVADQVCLVVVVEVVPGDGDPVRSADDVNGAVLLTISVRDLWGKERIGLTHIVIGASGNVRGELIVIDPHASRVADRDAVVVSDLADLDVADDDVVRVPDVEALLVDVRRPPDSDDGLVRLDIQTLGKGNVALDVDDGGLVARGCGYELIRGGDDNLLAALAAGGHTDGIVPSVALDLER